MDDKVTFTDIEPKAAKATPTAAQVSGGIPVPPVRLLQVMSAEDWEGFTEEWLTYHKSQGQYDSVKRYSGAGDLGLDVVAFTAADFSKPWDSYQCKHYDHALEPNDIYGEVGKIIYHSFNHTPPFNQTCRVPRKHVFVSPCGVGITVGRWLKDPNRFREAVREKWESHCVPKIGAGVVAPLEGDLLQYFDAFDFSIFDARTGVELIEEHAQTPFYAARFGGGLPPRESPADPPLEPTEAESPYLTKLLDAYGDHLGQNVSVKSELESHPDLEEHYNRQRVLFYSAESLRNFARDRTPPLTFESLQDDIYHGIIDINEGAHTDALVPGIRTLAILIASYPRAHDLGRLVQYDYLAVHSADADGPPSLHPPLPLRSGELLVRRGLIESGLRLMMSRSLIRREIHPDGILYAAEDAAGAFLANLQADYIIQLRDRAEWVSSTFDGLSSDELDVVVKRLFEAWTTEFQPVQFGPQAELLG